MIIEQLIKEKRKIKYRYLSEHSQRGKITARYIDYSPTQKFKKAQKAQPQSISCTVQLSGSSCQLEVGKIAVEMKNEPTEALKNKKPRIHQQVVPYAPDLGIPSRYGGWVSPYEMVNRGRLGPSRIERKKKTYEYY